MCQGELGGNLLQGNLQSRKTLEVKFRKFVCDGKDDDTEKWSDPFFLEILTQWVKAEEKLGGEERTTVGGKFNLEDKPTSYEKHNVQSFLRAFHVFFCAKHIAQQFFAIRCLFSKDYTFRYFSAIIDHLCISPQVC